MNAQPPVATSTVPTTTLTVHDQVVSIVAMHLDMLPTEIRPDARIVEDLGADSLAVVEIALALEDQFSIDIADEDIAKLATIADVEQYCRARVASGDNA